MIDQDHLDRSRQRRGRQGPPVAAVQMAAQEGRTVPHSLEAEEYLLSCALLDGADVIGKAYTAGITADSFYLAAHGIAWCALEKLWHDKKPTDVACLAETLKSEKLLDQVGGFAFLTQISSRVPTTMQAAFFIEKVAELAELRAVIRAGSDAVERCYNYAGGGLDQDGGIVAALDRLQGLRVKSERTLPPILSDAQLESAVLPEPPQLIEGVLHQGRRTLLLAPSKVGKTWTAMDVSISIATGTPWLGFRTHQTRVLHIDLELPIWGLNQRRDKLLEVRGIKGAVGVDWWPLDGYQRSIDELMPLILARAPIGKYGMITIEPAYVILGARDENDNADITDFMNKLAWMARLTGAAVLCTHHFAKGDASKKDTKDRGSGAGSWMRAPDTAITMTPLDEAQGEDCYSMEFIERNMKRHAPIGVKFEYPVFRLQSGLDLNALREAGRPKKSTEADVVRLLADDDLTHGQWLRLADKKGMSERTFNRRIAEAIEAGLVVKNGPIYLKAKAGPGGVG